MLLFILNLDTQKTFCKAISILNKVYVNTIRAKNCCLSKISNYRLVSLKEFVYFNSMSIFLSLERIDLAQIREIYFMEYKRLWAGTDNTQDSI